jgi:hypothetical protein
MAITSNMRFKGVDNTLVDLQERRSSQINEETEYFSISDFSDAITGGVDIAALETQVESNTAAIINLLGAFTSITTGQEAYDVTDMGVFTIKTTFTPTAANTHTDGFEPGGTNPTLPTFAILQLTRTGVGVYETAGNITLFNNEFRLTIDVYSQTLSPIASYYQVTHDAINGKFILKVVDASGTAQDLSGEAIIKYVYYNV